MNQFEVNGVINESLKISKNDKKAIFSFKSKVNQVNNPDSTEEKIFNYRQSIKNVINENYEKVNPYFQIFNYLLNL